MEEQFTTESCVCDFHVYKDVWTPNQQETSSCSREPGNIHNLYAFAIKTGLNIIVGHVPRTISGTEKNFAINQNS